MSTFYSADLTCAVCGSVNSYEMIGSTNAFGAPDLDLRPPQMQRSTMFAWVQECPSCGYAAANVSRPTCVTREFLDSKPYINYGGMVFRSILAGQFYRQYLNLNADGSIEGAFFAILHAVWACDDTNDVENARSCRALALAALERLNQADSSDAETRLLIRADLLRRSGQFAEVIRLYRDLHFSEEILESIRAFQVRKAGEEDDRCYTVQDAVGN